MWLLSGGQPLGRNMPEGGGSLDWLRDYLQTGLLNKYFEANVSQYSHSWRKKLEIWKA